ncbi:GPI ethanolamine phosphate transferase 1 [Drosophila grimshawi]|uniref:GPI ethanolamine phosphate transferase 1 n=1 Tax=Drosophila grimshawi TaxID=7222 RepID=B4J9D1_DROGR|nr:GPI ethanolamine phosphate transferase 1 [Drosophila grimshawi]EDW01412.1 GH21426 [Drosophila grimshawi]
MWVVYALVLHLLLLGSIFVIYFRSPVIEGLQPQAALNVEPPANRLVLIVTDGLRAESFFAENCGNVPHLRKIFMREGIVGISRTRVPTESRPGHIALIAGLYEDPSAVTRGWKENPIEFDTVFNRSEQTYAWGAHDVLHIFEKLADSGRPMYFDAYNHDLDFSGQHKTYKQDEWVFDRVRLLLNRKREELRNAKKIVFFLHLLGLDTAGHVHKPGTPLFLENLKFTEEEIYKIYQRFEETFPDNRTAYLLTSDHGMTDSGSHGAGAAYETDTPFMLWGAGVARSANTGITFTANAEGLELPLRELEQAQLTPLMSALIGLPPPMNNFGILPLAYMSAGDKYEALAAHSNALQLLAQYKRLQEQHKRGILAPFLNSFEQLTSLEINAYMANTAAELRLNEFKESLINTNIIMKLALQGIDYYHGYYRNWLLICTTFTFLGWILYLYRLLTHNRTTSNKEAKQKSRATVPLYLAAMLLIVFVVVQRVPISVGFYLLLPLIVWMLVMRQGNHSTVAVRVYSQTSVTRGAPPSWAQLLLLIACAELLVFTFFERRLISLCFLAFNGYRSWGNLKPNTLEFYKWLFLVITLSCFPLLPLSVGYQNNYLLLAGILLLLLRAFLSRERWSYSWHTKLCNALILINTTVCIYLHSHQLAVPLPLKLFSWLYLVYAILSIHLSKETSLEVRLAQITYNFGTLYALLCMSYEALFIQLLTMELVASLGAQCAAELFEHKSLQSSVRLAFTILLYTFFSLFGSGNIASISSFDPNVARCFLSHFAPFVIMSLVLLKLLLPVVLNLAIVYTNSEYARQQEQQIFICLLLICDIMGLNFLFLVRNTGSWLEIGSSISHFVIMEVTTLVLLLLAYAAKWLLRPKNGDRAECKLN